MDITLILRRRYPDSFWTLNGDDYSGLEWHSDSPKPTEAELEALWDDVQYETAYENVEKARAEAYRETADPLFFQYQAGEATEEEWLSARQAVRDANPYPERTTL
jgi:hypothetical protein